MGQGAEVNEILLFSFKQCENETAARKYDEIFKKQTVIIKEYIRRRI